MNENDTAVVTSASENHPLASKWCWSYKPAIVYKQQTKEDWLADYRPLIAQPVDSAELFWKIFHSVPTLASLDFGNIYALFKDNIPASWEDPANENGYSVLLYMNKHVTNDFTTQLYQQALLTVIGNHEPFCEHLNGCTIERKTGGNKIAFWMSSSADNSRDAQRNTAAIIIKALRMINLADVAYAEEDGRVEWRDAKFASFKIAVKCMSHKKRALEPVQTRTFIYFIHLGCYMIVTSRYIHQVIILFFPEKT
jgi:hypothetical protein